MIALATGKVIKIPPPRTVKPKTKGTMRKHHSCKSEIGHVKTHFAGTVRRSDLSAASNEYNFVGSGSYGRCTKMTYHGNILVVVKAYRTGVGKSEALHEAETILSLQHPKHHPNLPFLMGVNVESEPYLLVTQFLGEGNDSYTLSEAIRENVLNSGRDWLQALETIAKAISFMHEKSW